MKAQLNLQKLISSLLFAWILTMGSALSAQEQKSTELKDFKIIVEKIENGIKMQGLKGSAWTNLTFSIKNDRPQAIDEYGMTDLDKVKPDKASDLADFLFTITKNEGWNCTERDRRDSMDRFDIFTFPKRKTSD